MTISATIIQDSITRDNKRITTFELEYPRFIHSEFMTHRQFSRNCASSRAIPIHVMHQHIRDNMAYPVHWGKNQAGMQAKEEIDAEAKASAKIDWEVACDTAIHNSRMLASTGLHKQIANRVTEPFQTMKTVVTATEWENWFWLRFHADAQPEIHELAKQMLNAHIASFPVPVFAGEWHVPYVTRRRSPLTGTMEYYTDSGTSVTVQDARIVSTSCCAQVSYRKSDDSIEKAREIYDRLITSEPVHASPTEHQATPMDNPVVKSITNLEPGVTHVDTRGRAGSGNFYGWIQHRQLIPGQAR